VQPPCSCQTRFRFRCFCLCSKALSFAVARFRNCLAIPLSHLGWSLSDANRLRASSFSALAVNISARGFCMFPLCPQVSTNAAAQPPVPLTSGMQPRRYRGVRCNRLVGLSFRGRLWSAHGLRWSVRTMALSAQHS